MDNSIRTERSTSLITLDSVGESEYQKDDTLTAQLRQVVTTVKWYPAKRVSNEMNGSLFSGTEFGFDEQSFESVENRVAWVFVPLDATEATVNERLVSFNAAKACIYRVLSYSPILSRDQQWSIDNGRKTLDDFADAQVMRYPENETTLADETAGTLILDQATRLPMYRKTYFWGTPREDEDARSITNTYLSPAIKAELFDTAEGEVVS